MKGGSGTHGMIEPVSSATDAPRPESQPDAESDAQADAHADAQAQAPRPKSWPRRVWPFAALGAGIVVVGLGTATLVAIQPPAPAAPSRSVLAVRSAHDDAARLAALARGAGQSAAAEVLDRQAAVLATAPGVGPGIASGSTTANASPSASGTGGTTAVRELVDGLSASVAALLAALGEVDGPTATLVASLASGQSLEIDDLTATTGVTPSPAASGGPTGTSGPSASPSPSASCATPSASASPTPLAAALAAVDRSENASVYVLETALARAPRGTAEAQARAAALDARRRQLTAVAALAAANCTALPAEDPAFAVPTGFAADPSPTISAESEAAEQAWAELVGALPAASRPGAASGLLTAARLGSARGSAPEKAFPGVPSAQEPAQQSGQQPTRQP